MIFRVTIPSPNGLVETTYIQGTAPQSEVCPRCMRGVRTGDAVFQIKTELNAVQVADSVICGGCMQAVYMALASLSTSPEAIAHMTASDEQEEKPPDEPPTEAEVAADSTSDEDGLKDEEQEEAKAEEPSADLQ